MGGLLAADWRTPGTMAPMARATRHQVALAATVQAVITAAAPSPTAPIARAASPVGVGQIVAGSAGRSSLALDVVYRSHVKLTWSGRATWVESTAIVTNPSVDLAGRLFAARSPRIY